MRQPDLNAPRFRLPVHGTLNGEFYKEFRDNNPDLAYLSDEELRKIVSTMNELIWETAISYRDGMELPEQMGYIFLASCPPKVRKNVDFRKSLDYMKVIEHRNWDSDRFLMKIMYANSETRYRFKYHGLWSFSATRKFRRTASAAYIKDWKKYIQLDHGMRVSELFRKRSYKIYMKKKEQEQLESYDELNL